MDVNPDIATHLAANGITEDGKPNRDWFKESCERSKRAIEEGRIEANRELQRILDEEV